MSILLTYIRENITPRGDGNHYHLEIYEYCNVLYKREYNSERRRKHSMVAAYTEPFIKIRENITPRGDGNLGVLDLLKEFHKIIRENITPRGDGNKQAWLDERNTILNKREYNSERRRKLITAAVACVSPVTYIRENITPRGDGNLKFLNHLHYNQ